MNTMLINIKKTVLEESEVQELEKELSTVNNCSFSIEKSSSFDGFQDLIIILSIGGGVAIKQIGEIILAWIKINQSKSIKYKNIEISGFSSEEVAKILKEIKKYE